MALERRNNRLIQTFLQAQEGVAMMEFVIVLPVLVILSYYSIELTRAMLAMQKVEKSIILINNITTQYLAPGSGWRAISQNQLDTLMTYVPNMLAPFSKPGGQVIYLSDVTTGASPSSPTVSWQYRCGISATKASKIGQAGKPATLPAGFTMNANDEVVIGEIFYDYTPIVPRTLAPFTYYRISVFTPRYASLSNFVPTARQAATCP